MNQRIEYEIFIKCGKIRNNCIFLRGKIIILIKIRSEGLRGRYSNLITNVYWLHTSTQILNWMRTP